jgi:hypothetical protein
VLTGLAALPVSAATTSNCSVVTSQHAENPNQPGVEAAPTAETATVNVVDLLGSQSTVAIPPASWKPLTASDTELAYYGFPDRPRDPAGLSAWNAEWSHYTRTVVPTMCVGDSAALEPDGAVLDPLGDLLGGSDVSNAAYTSFNWAGVAAKARTNYTTAYGSMVVPNQAVCAGTQTSEHVAWVGLGAWGGGGKLLQNGLEQYGSGLTNTLWYEGLNTTYDTHIVRISSPTAAPGQTVNVATKYQSGTVTFSFHNLATGVAANPAFSTMAAYNRSTGALTNVAVSNFYDGRSAEAVDERPYSFSAAKYYQLRNFGRNSWYEASAATGTFTTRTAMRDLPHDAITMKNRSGSTVLAAPGAGTTQLRFYDDWKNCGVME